MTDLELSGRVLPAPPDADTDRVAQLTAAWLARRTKNTQREYRADLTHWWHGATGSASTPSPPG